MLIDSHCHLDYFSEAERPDVLARAAAAGVGGMVTIGTTLAQSRRLPAIAETQPNLWCTVGIHPHHAAEEPVPAPEDIAALTSHPKVIGIGESGLDYFYDRSPRDVQQAGFRAHIRAARLAGLPLAIHARDADHDIAAILQDEHDSGGEFSFLLHCFSSSRALAEAAIAIGGYVSFSGILTFPKSNELREIARDLPADRLLVETDAPYLAPVPFRGKRNEPAYRRPHRRACWPRCAAWNPRRSPTSRRRTSAACSARRPERDAGDPARHGRLRRRAADRRRGRQRRLGRLRSVRAAQPPNPDQHRRRERQRDAPAGRYRAGTCASSCWRVGCRGWTRFSIPMRTPTTSPASTMCGS